ncbi:MAG: hypothetical protein F6J93_05865 [Oscillatoria sp. SIO1A7]|nr:hypothetical protein [Oscillatoria sp. SIO1A7]
MTDSIDLQIAYWMERAEETLEEARILASASHWNACRDSVQRSAISGQLKAEELRLRGAHKLRAEGLAS